MTHPESGWPEGGKLSVSSISATEEVITWDISEFRCLCARGMHMLRSNQFTFHKTMMFLFIEYNSCSSSFGIHISKYVPYEGLRHNYDISLKSLDSRISQSFDFSLHEVESFKGMAEINDTYKILANKDLAIVCRISKKIIDLDTTGALLEAVEYPTQSKLPENKDKEISMVNLENKVCQDFKNLLLSEKGSDVTIQVGDRQFKVHRSVLTARSSVFASMLRPEMKSKVVKFKDCEPLSFSVLLDYIYCGSTENLTLENVFTLYTSADKYDLQDFKTKCLEFIRNKLSVDTFCETIALALQHSEADLLKHALEFFANNYKKIILTTKWQAFIVENPSQSNEIFIKAFHCGPPDK